MQLELPNMAFGDENSIDDSQWRISLFSADNVNPQKARLDLEKKYWPITEISDRFNRRNVSYQKNKNKNLHRWLKYKEGFSAELVEILLNDFKLRKGDVVMDPFMGSGTTAMVSVMNGYNCIGFDILPMSRISIDAKLSVFDYDVEELRKLRKKVLSVEIPKDFEGHTSEISITKEGYPNQTNRELAFYKQHFHESRYSENAKTLLELSTINVLERISYSAKDGQYLRWNHRCPKIVRAEAERKEKGLKPLVVRLDKGDLPSLKEALSEELDKVIDDIILFRRNNDNPDAVRCDFTQGSALYELPKIKSDSVDAVITSPPYCNRYDYTRTYALELAYLGITDEDIKRLRQDLVSCTVENRSKVGALHDYYAGIGALDRFEKIMDIVSGNEALSEIRNALTQRNDNGEINNRGVLKMVDGYFTELAFLFAELFRVCKSGAYVAFVNDNVRYAGEVIPVDFLTTDIARQLGFTPVKIYTTRQLKGNSSQQMKKYGRVALRKSVTIWKK